MIKKIELTKVIMEGFKFYKDKTAKDFSLSTIFVGGNGKGKSTIADAISWAITGKIYEGKKQIENGILNNDSLKAVVEVYFLDEFGVERVIKRTYTEASGVSLWLDKVKISQKTLQELIDVDKFLLSFNPFTFLTKKQQEARGLMIDIVDLSSVTDDIVLNSLSKPVRILLNNITIGNIENVGKETQKARKNLISKKNQLIVLNGHIEKNNETLSKKIMDKKELVNEKAIADLEIKIEELILNKPNIDSYAEALVKKSKFDKEIAIIEAKVFDSSMLLTLNNKQEKLSSKLKSIEDMIFNPQNLLALEMEIKSTQKESNRLLNENTSLNLKIDKIKAEYRFNDGDNCPCCKQVITATAIDNLSKFVLSQTEDYVETDISNKSRINDLEVQLKEISDKVALIKAEDIKNEKAFNKNQEISIKDIKKEISANNKLIKEAEKEKKEFETNKKLLIKPILDSIKELKLSELKKSINEYEVVIKNEKKILKDLKKQDSIIEEFNRGIDFIVKANKKLEKEIKGYNKEILSIEKDILTLNYSIDCIKEFNQAKIRMIEDIMKRKFNKVSFKIEEINPITLEVKPCFKVFYENKIIEQCSLSEQMKAGMEIVEMLKETFNIDYPMFLDNAESIIEVNSSINQIIRTVVIDVEDVITVNESILSEINVNSKDIVLNSIA